MLKHLITLSALLLGASFAQANDAPLCTEENMDGCALTLTGGPPDSPVQCSSEPQIIVYTVHNDAFDDVDLDPIIDTLIIDTSPDSTVEIDENPLNSDCYLTMPPSVPAQDSCTLTVIITPVDCPLLANAVPMDFPQFIKRKLLPQENVDQTPLEACINVTVTGALEDFLTALPGINQGNPQNTQLVTDLPLLVTRTADGIWENIDTTFFSEGEFQSATCTGTDDDGVCIAVGTGKFRYFKSVSSELQLLPKALFFASQDGGLNWDIPDTGPSYDGVYNSVACSNEGDDSARCVAAGAPDTSDEAIAAQTIDGGINWAPISSPFGDGYWTDVACTDLNTTNGFCLFVGQSTSGGQVGVLDYSKKQLQITPAPSQQDSLEVLANDAVYFATACAGTGAFGNNTACTVVGTDTGTTDALLLSGNTPISWDTEVAGTFFDTACTKSIGNNVVCTAVGQTAAGDSMLYVNKDVTTDSDAWAPVATATDAMLRGTACKSNATTMACIAVGNDDEGNSLLYVNTDVTGLGSMWNTISAPDGTFNGAACTLTAGDTIACTVAGVDPNGAPLIFTSSNVLSNLWGTPTTTPPLSTATISGCLNGAGASGASSNLKACSTSVTLSEPLIMDPVDCNSGTQSITYSVEKDGFSAVELAIDLDKVIMDDTSPNSSVTIDEPNSSCFDTNPPSIPTGQGSCTIKIDITAASCPLSASSEQIAYELTVTPDLFQAPLTSDIYVTVNDMVK